jgi:hypothetical protein
MRGSLSIDELNALIQSKRGMTTGKNPQKAAIRGKG